MEEQYIIEARKTAKRAVAIGVISCVIGWLGIAGAVCSLNRNYKTEKEESTAIREYVIENAEILEFKGDLDYLVLRDKINTNNSVKLAYREIEQFNLPRKELADNHQKPFALVREFNDKTNADIYPLDGISPRRYIR